MAVERRFVFPALAVGLVVAAIMLWLSAPQPGIAATANQTQGLALAVPSTISWGSAGLCTQNMPAYDFGSVGAGATATSSVFTGCVTSNATWAVAASMTAAPSNGSTTIPANSFVGQVVTSPLTSTVGCSAVNTTCQLGTSRTLFSGAPATTLNLNNQFTYQYALTVPAGQDSGSYTGGVVTFVASN